MFDPTTAGLYIAAGTPVARAQAVSDSLGSGTLTATIYDTGVEVYSGTFAGPLTVGGVNGELSVAIRPTGTASGAGTPDAATWKVRISNASGRWLEGTLGPTGRFQLSDALSIGRTITLGVSIDPQGGVFVPPPSGTYSIAPLGQPRILFSNAVEVARLNAIADLGGVTITFLQNQLAQVMAEDYSQANSYHYWWAAFLGKLRGNDAARQWAVNKMDAAIAEMQATADAGQRPWVAVASLRNRIGIRSDSWLNFGAWMQDIACVYDWCRDLMSPAMRARWVAFGELCCNNLWNWSQETWGGVLQPGTGYGMTRYSNNYYQSFLRGTMFWGLATYGESPTDWLTKYRITELEGKHIPHVQSLLLGGGSLEGIGYGVSMGERLFEPFWFWKVSTGENIASLTTHTYNSGLLMLHGINPAMTSESLNGDHSYTDARLDPYNAHYLRSVAGIYPGTAVAGLVKTLLATSPVSNLRVATWSWSRMQEFLWDLSNESSVALNTLPTAYLAQGSGYLYGRDSWTTDATWFNLVCGRYEEDHSHQEHGAFLIWKNKWMALDANLYNLDGTRGGVTDTWGPSHHNLIRVEQSGVQVNQKYNSTSTYLAASNGAHYLYALMDTLGAYSTRPQITKMQREFVFIRPGCFVIFDRVGTTGTGVERIWNLNVPVSPVITGDSMYVVSGSDRMDVIRTAPAGLSTVAEYWPTIRGSRYTAGYRISTAHSAGDSNEFLHVIGMNSVVTSAVVSDATGQTGTLITFADGGTARVRFSTAGTGGDLHLVAPGGSVLVSESFTTTVDL